MASSRRRASARTSSRLATLAQSISSTIPMVPIASHRLPAIEPASDYRTVASESGLPVSVHQYGRLASAGAVVSRGKPASQRG